MNRLNKIKSIRKKLSENRCSIGSWIQLPGSSGAEIMGSSGYDWVAVDMEHGSISTGQLPDIFRALELGDTLPLVRLAEGSVKDCKRALDAGAGGVIVPMIESSKQLELIANSCRWPPSGNRGVGFSRANLFGKNFKEYAEEAKNPLLIAMIENIRAVDQIEDILNVKGLDAILIGPYDLSASISGAADFESRDFILAMNKINEACKKKSIPSGIHIVIPSTDEFKLRLSEGYRFIAYAIDAVFLSQAAQSPIDEESR